MKYPGFVGPSNVLQSFNADQERTVNLYQEKSESPGASSPWALYPTPGVEDVTLTLPLVAAPDTPVITQGGTPAFGTYDYVVVSLLAAGNWHSSVSHVGETTTGAAALNATDYNIVTWAAVTGAVRYDVYRTSGTVTKIASATTALTVNDTGGGTAEAAPTTDTTGLAFTPNGSGIAHFYGDGREFAVIGNILYEIALGGRTTPRGTVAIDSNPATIHSNGDGGGQLFITSGGNGYYYTLSTNTLTQITALNGKATMGDMIDGYFLAFDASTSTWYISDLLDGATWDPTQFVQRSSQGDPWVSLKVSGPYIYLLGDQTSEVWYDAGSFPIPFAKHSSGNMPYGCAAPFSPEIVGGAITWLGKTANGQGVVLRTSGFAPEVISTYATQVAFSGYSSLSDAVGDTYEDLGHTFYLLTFPAANATWCWDSELRLWHERGTWISESMQFDAWRPLFHAMAFNEHRMLDRSTGNVYRMSSDVGTDVDGRPLRRVRRAPGLVYENQRLFYPGFELDVEPGVGLTTGQGSNPQVMLRLSNDGGHTWGTEQMRTLGAIGNYQTRVRWLRCGSARRRVFEVSISDPVPLRITNAYLTDFQAPAGAQQQRSA